MACFAHPRQQFKTSWCRQLAATFALPTLQAVDMLQDGLAGWHQEQTTMLTDCIFS
jgi:hypothetical protein